MTQRNEAAERLRTEERAAALGERLQRDRMSASEQLRHSMFGAKDHLRLLDAALAEERRIPEAALRVEYETGRTHGRAEERSRVIAEIRDKAGGRGAWPWLDVILDGVERAR